MRIDIDRVAAGEMFTMVRVMKADSLSHLQPNTTVAHGRQYGVVGFEGRRRIIPEEGKVYTNRNGDRYLCLAAPGPMSTCQDATMQRVSDKWTVNVHNVYQTSDGIVEWGLTTLGHWPT